MKGRVTKRPEGTAPSGALRVPIVTAGLKSVVLGLSSLLLAPVAISQGPGALARPDRDSHPGSHDVATLGSSTAIADPALLRSNPVECRSASVQGAPDSSSSRLWIRPMPELASRASVSRLSHPEAVVSGAGSPSAVSVYFRHPTGDVSVAFRAESGGGQAPDQLLAAIGIRNLSIRFNSWRAVGRTPSVEAGTLGFARLVTLVRSRAEIGLGGAATVYRFGARFDPAYRRHPFSIHGFLRIRFGSPANGQASPPGHPTTS